MMEKRQEVGVKRESRRLKLTDRDVRFLPSGETHPIDYSDTTQKGLRLRVTPHGRRVFLCAYRSPTREDKLPRRVIIGEYNSKAVVTVKGREKTVTLTLAVARGRAADIMADVRAGKDPIAERAANREKEKANTITFAAYCDAFMAEELPEFRPATAAGWERYIKREIVPALGDLKPEEITAERIAEMKAIITKGIRSPKARTWKRKPAPVSARRAFEVVRRILEWATTTEPDVSAVRKRYGLTRLDVNPAAAAKGYRGRRRRNGKTRAEAASKAFTDDQLRAIFTAADDEGAAFHNLVALVAHTAVRAHDARAARWKDIDLHREVWSIPMHKTSDHTGAPHLVPISSGALDVLNRLRRANLAAGRSEWVFPAPTSSCEVCGEPGHTDKDAKTTRKVKTAAGIEDRGLLHRMRDTIKTRMSENGIDGRVSEAILCHLPPGITGTYDHAELLPQRKKALQWWSDELAGILTKKGTGKAQKRPARR